MYVGIEDWKNGWFEVEIGIDPKEIDILIDRLKMIRDDHEQHFHITREIWEEKGVGKLTFYIRQEKEEHNMSLGSRAYLPGEEIELSDK